MFLFRHFLAIIIIGIHTTLEIEINILYLVKNFKDFFINIFLNRRYQIKIKTNQPIDENDTLIYATPTCSKNQRYIILTCK